jgi:putative nucleotidyltransferase with HDIG domain
LGLNPFGADQPGGLPCLSDSTQIIASHAITPKEIKARLKNVPALPIAILQLISLDLTAPGAFDKIVKVAEEDPPLTSKLLALAYSAGFAPTVEIVSIRQAVSRIGAKRLAELIVTMALTQIFEPRTADEKTLWAHSILTAIAARHLATTQSEGKVDPQAAYMCGLLHDIGRFVFFDGVPAELQRADEFGWTSSTGLMYAEREAVGIDHSEIGWHACEHLGIPESVGSVIRYHHHYMRKLDEIPANINRELLDIVQTAEFVAALMETPPTPLEVEPDEIIPLLERRGEHLSRSLAKLNLDQIAALLPSIAQEAGKLSGGLSC